jgi:hypothetical protein
MPFCFDNYTKNMKAINEKYPELLKCINSVDGSSLEIEFVDAKDGNISCSLLIQNSRKFIHSPYKPVEEAQRWVSTLPLQPQSIICMFGFGLGYHALQLVETLQAGQQLIIYEPMTEMLAAAVGYMDLTSVFSDDRVHLVAGVTEQELFIFMSSVYSWMQAEYTVSATIPIYEKLYPEQCKVFIAAVRNTMHFALIKRDTLLSNAYLWTKNVLQNLPYIAQSTYAGDLEGKLAGLPAVVVAAGPSLNKNVKLLKRVQGKALIICVDTALRVLINYGIVPDFIACVDQSELNYKHFEGLPYSNIPILFLSTAYPGILKDHQGFKVLLSIEGEYVSSLLEVIGKKLLHFRKGGSVSHYAMDFTLLLGANPVVFIGLDLAYTGNSSHAEGTSLRKDISSENLQDQMDYVFDMQGNSLVTSKVLKAFHTWFEKAVAQDNTGRLYINATEGGAYIRGMAHMSFSDAIDKYCKNTFVTDVLLKNIIQREIFDKSNHFRILDYLQKMHEDICKVQKIVNEGIHICTSAHNLIDVDLMVLQGMRTECSSIIIDIALLNWIREYIEYKVYLHDNFVDKDQASGDKASLYDSFLFFFNNVQEACNYVEPLLRNAMYELSKKLSL